MTRTASWKTPAQESSGCAARERQIQPATAARAIIPLTGDDSAVSMDMMCERTGRLIEDHRHHWRREVNEKGAANWLTERVVTLLAGLDLVTRDGDLLTPRPAIGRFAVRTAEETPARPIPS